MRLSRRGLIAASLSTALVVNRSHEARSESYAGKTFRLLVGTGAGGGYDLVARLLATHISKFIPGYPNVVVENMPGAGSLTMINYLYSRAPRDGSVIGLPLNGILHEPTLKVMTQTGGADFDAAKLNWIGSTSEEPYVLWFMSDSKTKTIEDLRSIESTVAAGSHGADNYTIAALTNELLGAQMRIIRGYQGSQPVFLAAERGEVEGSATGYAAVVVTKGEWLRNKKIRVLIQYGSERIRELPDVPTAIELVDSAEGKEMLAFLAIRFKAAYPFVMPPGVAAKQVGLLRSAFDQTVKDPAFIGGMQKLGLSVRPMTGDAIAQMVQSTYAVPKRIVDRLRSLMIATR